MKFLYTATTKEGKRVRAEILAASRQEALSTLKSKLLTVTSLTHMEKGRQIYIGGITAVQKVVFTKHLAVMLRSGIGLREALSTIALQSKGKLQEVLNKVCSDVESGIKFSDALAKHKKVFNQYYISMVSVGEESGHLVEDLEQLSAKYAKDHDLMLKVRSALMYPGVVLGLTFGLMMAIAIFILPKLTLLFKSLKYQLPWYTKVLLVVSQFFAHYGIEAFVGIIVGICAIVWVVRQPFSAPVVHRIYLKLPIVGNIVRTVNLARFSMICGSLLKSGIPITQALTTTGNVIDNVVYRKALLDAVPRVNKGEPFSSAIEDSNLFPLFVVRMIAAGEQTGELANMFLYLSNFYEEELDATLKNLSVLLEPALLIFISIIVLGIALSIISPIYNFIGSLS